MVLSHGALVTHFGERTLCGGLLLVRVMSQRFGGSLWRQGTFRESCVGLCHEMPQCCGGSRWREGTLRESCDAGCYVIDIRLAHEPGVSVRQFCERDMEMPIPPR